LLIFLIFSSNKVCAEGIPTTKVEIEEIIVKASWRETKLEKADASIFVIGQEVLIDQPVKHFEQLTQMIPNLNWAGGSSRPRYFQIRGIGERSGYEGTPNSSVGFIIDDIDFSGLGGIATTFDLEQVEVHRGPQGLRMGANALAGLIYMQSKNPTDAFEGIAELVYGSDDNKSLGIAMGGPINEEEKLKYRVVLRQDKANGFRNNSWLAKDSTSGKKEFTGRIKLNWQPNSASTIDFLLMNVDLENGYDAWTMDNSLSTLSDKPGRDSQDTNVMGLKMRFRLNEKFELQSLTGLTHSDVLFSFDADWGNNQSWQPYVYDFFSETLRSRRSLNHEFRLISEPMNFVEDKPMEWIAGIYYLDLNERNDRHDLGVYDDPFDNWSAYLQDDKLGSDYASENLAVFGNIDYAIASQTTISLGMRWERWTSTYADTLGEFFSPSDRMLGGKLSLRTKLNEFANIYATVARGYKSGGFNLGTGIQGVERLNDLIYDPEYLWNYEIGTSVLSPNSNLLIEAVVFWSDRKNQQVLISKQLDPNNPTTFQYLTQNAASGKNYGTELNLRAKLTDKISLFAALGLLKTEIKHHQSRPELEGRRQAHAPAKSYSIGIKWQTSEQFHLSMDLSGKSDFYFSDSHREKSKPYTLVNLSLGYRHKDWIYEVWVRNLFDRYYSVRGFYFGNQPPSFPNQLYQRQGDPRHWGVLVRYEF